MVSIILTSIYWIVMVVLAEKVSQKSWEYAWNNIAGFSKVKGEWVKTACADTTAFS